MAKKMRTTPPIYLLMSAILLQGACAEPDDPVKWQHPTLDSYLGAKTVFERALIAHGGADSIQAIERVDLTMEGSTVMRHQSVDHSTVIRTPRTDHMILDFASRRAYRDTDRFFGADLHEGDRVYVMNGDDIFTYIDETDTAQDNDPANRFPNTTFIEWSLPRLILKEIIKNPISIRSLGPKSIAGTSYEVLTFPWPNSQVVSLYFDVSTGLLNRLSRPMMDALEGDTAIDYVYEEYGTNADGATAPTTLRVELAGELVIEQGYKNIVFNGDLDESVFERPENVQFVHMDPPTGNKLVKVTENVYVVDFPQTRPNVSFVIFEDYILAVDAPANSFYSSQAIDAIRAVSDKPIRYVIPTHHHDDHSGGLRAFVAEGATVITPSGDLDYYRRMIGAKYTIFPDVLSSTEIAAIFEIVDFDRVLKDKNNVARIINIGSPHAKDMYIVWLPGERIVITADTFEFFDGHPVAAASNAAVAFAQSLDNENIKPEVILESHSRAWYAWEDLQTSLKLRAKQKNK